ncbi:MAG: LacI family DNA-binding transcriptional regulator [Pseudorhodobacter sp.]|nr:LacI family DNA-binding transcriptional regulator [Pseudorhodobacter sp.]
MTTIRDVALAAGVSVGTVSKVLNKTGTIAIKTRARVTEVAQALNFRPNTLAQSLHSGLSGSIGLISNDSFGRFTMPIMEGLEAVLATEGVGVFMCNATDDPDRERRHVEQLLSKQIDGLIVTSRRSDHRPAMQLAGLTIPVIHVFAHADDPDALSLLPDDEGGARLAVAHLAQTRARIAHVTGPARFEAVRLRVAGYRAALRDAGLPALPVLHGPWSEAWGREAVAQLLTNPPDAIFCGNDQIARGAADALREAGRRVPQDVALIGFDNWGVIAEACRPPLSSVDMNLAALGAEAGRRMLSMIAGETFRGLERLPCALFLRAST